MRLGTLPRCCASSATSCQCLAPLWMTSRYVACPKLYKHLLVFVKALVAVALSTLSLRQHTSQRQLCSEALLAMHCFHALCRSCSILQKAWAREEAQRRRDLARLSRAQSVPVKPTAGAQRAFVPHSVSDDSSVLLSSSGNSLRIHCIGCNTD